MFGSEIFVVLRVYLLNQEIDFLCFGERKDNRLFPMSTTSHHTGSLQVRALVGENPSARKHNSETSSLPHSFRAWWTWQHGFDLVYCTNRLQLIFTTNTMLTSITCFSRDAIFRCIRSGGNGDRSTLPDRSILCSANTAQPFTSTHANKRDRFSWY